MVLVEPCGPFSVLQPDRTNPLAKEELNLLARLMGCMKSRSVPTAAPRFRISLFPSDPEEDEER